LGSGPQPDSHRAEIAIAARLRIGFLRFTLKL
jgi:hypothetical protein